MIIIDWIKKLIQNVGCEHEYEFVRNIYGDEINDHNRMRSEWRCTKCGHVQYREDLHTVGTLCEELDKLYDDFYKDKYNSWKELRAETLNTMLKGMREAAYRGECWYNIVIVCEERYDDKYYYEKWLDENALKYDREPYHQKEKCTELNSYMFHIRWNYKLH